MKKPFLIILITIILLTSCLIIAAITISFKVVKQTTDKINASYKNQFQQIIRIPDPIPPQKSFHTTSYTWDMETPSGEVVRVKFTHDTGFSKKISTIIATLEMPEGEDPSIFNKVLPAVVSDKQAYLSAADPKTANLGENKEIGYKKINLYEVENREGQVSRITWEFEKNIFVEKNKDLFEKIYEYPEGITKTLYSLQRFIIEIFST